LYNGAFERYSLSSAAMEAGTADHAWNIDEIVARLGARDALTK
jgi:hypothetical protein